MTADLTERLIALRDNPALSDDGYALSRADRNALAEAVKELRDERDENEAAFRVWRRRTESAERQLAEVREALGQIELACVRLGVAEVKDGSVRLDNNEDIAGLAQALVQLRAALSPDQGTRAGTSEPSKSADTCPTCGSDDPAIDPSGAEYAPCDDPFHEQEAGE